MTRIALLTAEPIRERMAGIGIRYLELARRLPEYGFQVVLLTTGDVAAVPLSGLAGVVVRRFERGRLTALLADCAVAIAQGQVANDLVLEVPEIPTVIDLYDPFLVENLHYLDTLGLDPYRNDHATWVLQLARGDFFLCSSAEQQQFYSGFLTALGRIHPRLVAQDPDLTSLIGIVPFGIADQFPAHRSLLPPRRPGEKRLLFGGLYDWYDPWPVLQALSQFQELDWTLYLVRNPNPDGTPQKLWQEVQAWGEQRGLWQGRLQALEWVPAERRFDLLRDVDVLVSTHRLSLETRLSLRTRFLEALAVGCPVVTTVGGTMSRLLVEHGAGWVVPAEDPAAVGNALHEVLRGDPALLAARRVAGSRLLAAFSWDQALAPLVAFCRQPKKDLSKEEFVAHLPTRTPKDRLAFRLRRFWRRVRLAMRSGS